MSLREYRVLFTTVSGILALLVASPALNRLIFLPQTEFFTELWILDSNNVAEDYPFNITRNQNYSVSLGLRNRLGYCAYYLVKVKFRNKTQMSPDSFNRTSSNLPALFNIPTFVTDEAIWEHPITFSYDYKLNETLLRIEFSSLTLNNISLDLSNHTATWDPEQRGFFGNLFFELWIYNKTINNFHYHERFVSLWLNMTV